MSTAQILLSPGLLSQISKDAKFIQAFPFLRNVPAKLASAGCRGCGKASRQTYDWNGTKSSVVGLPNERKRLLLQLLDTKSLKVIYRKNGGGAMTTVYIKR